MRISAIVQFALTYAGVVLAEPEIDLLRYYDFGANDEFRDIYAAANGEFAVCGVRGSESGILARMDTEGEIIWLIETWDFMPRSIIEADNGDFIIAGGIEQVAAVMRVSADGGEVLWVETYGETVFNAVIELKSGEFVCCGRTTNVSGRIAAIDANGEIIWNRFYAPLGNIYQDFYALRETDEGVIAVGRAAAGAWIIRCNFEGEQIWNRILNAEVSRHFYSIVSGPNGYALGGIREDRWPWEGYRWAYTSLTGISADGDIQFDEVYPEQVLPGHRNYGVARISDGFVAVGWEIPDIFRGQFLRASHPIAHRTSPNGELVWRKDFHQIVGQVGMGNVTSNKLTSVITLPNNVIVACGSMVSNEEENGDDAIIVRLEPDILGPVVFHKEPEDSLLKVLPGETIDFLVRARNQQGEEMSYQWTYRDTVRSQDTSCTIRFDERGTFPVVCRVTAGEWSVEVVWAVEVTDLFISSFTPDTLDFTIQRANDIAFGIEVVYEGAWENLVMNWELADLAANRREEVGFGLEHVQRFDRTGGYALKARVFDPNVDPVPADSVQWAIQVRGVIRAFEPNVPEISLEPRQEATFELIPFNANNDSIEFWWTLDEADDTLSILSTLSISFADTGRYVVSGYAREQVGEEEWEEDVQRWAVNVGMLSVDDFGLDSGFRRNDDPLMISIAPNPFNDRATVTIDLGGRAFLPALRADKNVRLPSAQVGGLIPVRLSLYALDGREVLHLHDGPLSPGTHQFRFFTSFRMTSGVNMPSGVYLLRLQAGSHSRTVKAVLMR